MANAATEHETISLPSPDDNAATELERGGTILRRLTSGLARAVELHELRSTRATLTSIKAWAESCLRCVDALDPPRNPIAELLERGATLGDEFDAPFPPVPAPVAPDDRRCVGHREGAFPEGVRCFSKGTRRPDGRYWCDHCAARRFATVGGAPTVKLAAACATCGGRCVVGSESGGWVDCHACGGSGHATVAL